ncbi:MAG TPA: hypothetical protein VLI54_00370 [Bacillota bacterium]|nr:hypothetical protein [Bacillota bacterium]
MWSFQSGTSNPDGLIRLPGRLLLFIVFGLFGNVGAGYFYLFASLAIAFISFFLFARKFLGVKQTSVQVISALFFAVNPIFLGNLAKVGLVLAAAMLPFCLLAIRATFKQQKFRYLLLYILCLNISFLHPYTFAVNTAVSLAYFAYLAWQNKNFVQKSLHKFALIGVLGVLLNLYFVLPTLSMGTVSKDVISTNITPTPTDYTALVGISNTGDLFTGFSLSKNVFVDFAFYDDTYQNVYFFGVFAFYVILFGVYLRVERKLSLSDKRRLGVCFGCFLVLMALAAVTIAHLDVLIKMLIGMPGGWAFRSPLKWQLYIPLALFGILAILLGRLPRGRKLVSVQIGLLVTFVIMNGYIGLDVYRKILTPRTPQYFAGLQPRDLSNKTLLFVNNGDCMEYMRENPALTTELNQVFASQNTQVKHVIEDEADTVNLGSYDYILGCKDRLREVLTHKYRFAPVQQYAGNRLHLYANRQPVTPVYVTDQVFAPDVRQSVSDKYDFVDGLLGRSLTTVTAKNKALPTTSLVDAFDSLTPNAIQKGVIIGVVPASSANRTLYVRPSASPLYYLPVNGGVRLSAASAPGMQQLGAHTPPITVPHGSSFVISYSDHAYDYKNLVSNASLENGLWQKQVSDCYNYDAKPAIAMKWSESDKTDGKQSLELDAASHIACSGPSRVAVTAGEHYLLSFDYRSAKGVKNAGYHISYDDPAGTTHQERMQPEDNNWHTFGTEITVPEGAHNLRLEFYAYPDTFGRFTAVARYDQVGLRRIPPVRDRFYLVGKPDVSLHAPKAVRYQLVNPTRKTIQIRGAAQPFYLGVNETFDKLWQLNLQTKGRGVEWPFTRRIVVSETNHVHLNDTTNGWYIDPAVLCAKQTACARQADGTYSFALVAEFVPQRWFYFGGLISVGALGLSVTYYLYDRRRGTVHREGLWRWHK